MAQIVTLIIIPIIIVVFGLLFEYWIIQPLREKRANSRLINKIQVVPLQNYAQPLKGDLRLPPNNIIVISAFGNNIYDLSMISESVSFSELIDYFIFRAGIKEEAYQYHSYPNKYYLYSDWKRIEPNASFLRSVSKSPIFVLSKYPCYELFEASEAIQGELINTVPHKSPDDSREARLEYDYRTVLNLDSLSRKVKLVYVKNNKTTYRLLFQCKSIKDVNENGEVIFNDQCEVEITIPDGYPTEHPSIKIISKVLHPNISTHGSVCIRDCMWLDDNYQKNNVSLASMCLITIEMLEYHTFNLNNPFDMNAIKKFKYLKSIIPLDKSNLKGY